MNRADKFTDEVLNTVTEPWAPNASFDGWWLEQLHRREHGDLVFPPDGLDDIPVRGIV